MLKSFGIVGKVASRKNHWLDGLLRFTAWEGIKGSVVHAKPGGKCNISLYRSRFSVQVFEGGTKNLQSPHPFLTQSCIGRII